MSATPDNPVLEARSVEGTGTKAIVQATGVSKVYETGAIKVDALKSIDLVVKRGEMVAVTGPSGCGKTTLLNCLSGLDDLSEGKVLIDGVEIHSLPDAKKSEFRAKTMGFIFQAYNLLPLLTALENVELPLLVSGAKESAAEARALDSLEKVGLKELSKMKPMELSGGQQQRVAIARSIVNDPAIIWGDEPTGNLDSEASRDVIALLRTLNKEAGATLVLVTHDAQIAGQTDRVVVMRNGQILNIQASRSLQSG